MSQEVKIALVAIGGYGSTYVKRLLEADADRAVRIVAGIDPAPQRSGHLEELQIEELQARGATIYPDMESFYAAGETADLTIISSPIHFHAPQTCLALKNGSHVLCEKPLCATVQEAAEMAAAEQKAGRFVAIGYQWSFSDAIQSLKQDIMSGLLGKPRRLKTVLFWPRALSYYQRGRWAGALKSADDSWVLDSPANNATAHYLFNMFYVLGATRESSAIPVDVQAELYRAKPTENYDTAAIRCHTAAGAEILFYTTHAVVKGGGPIFQYEFEKATVEFGPESGNEIVARFSDGTVKSYGNPNETAEANKLWQCVESVRTGESVACTIAAARAQTLCINGAQESSAVNAFPQELIRTTEEDDNCHTWAEGLFEAFNECYERNILPAEHGGISWAQPGKIIPLSDYTHFPMKKENSDIS